MSKNAVGFDKYKAHPDPLSAIANSGWAGTKQVAKPKMKGKKK